MSVEQAAPIAALQGAKSAEIQERLAGFAHQMRARGLRVAGVIETSTSCDSAGCGMLALRDLATDRLISISQDLGAGSTACNLDPRGLAEACAAVERAIAEGADLVVISKFGKQEAARSGLIDAFRAAHAAGLPIVTAVSPAVATEWVAFAGAGFDTIDVNCDMQEAWWTRRERAILRAAAE